jgi:hypothetical protein
MPKRETYRINFWANFWKSLVAILIGNGFYFLLISPHLPPAGQHRDFAIDLGLIIDFWVCLVVYGVLQLVLRRKNEGRSAQ